MNIKELLLMLIMLLSLSIVTPSFVDLAKANPIRAPESLPVNQAYIRNDGSIDPPILPIEHSGNTYLLKGDILNFSMVIEKNDIILDGGGYLMSIPKYGEMGDDGQVKSVPPLIGIINHTNVIVRNFKFQDSGVAIRVQNSSNINISENSVIRCLWIYLSSCTNCSVVKNIMVDNTYGLYGYENDDVEIRYNQILRSSWHGIVLEPLSNSNIVGNIISDNNGEGVCYLGANNRVIGNVFQNNRGAILSYKAGNEIHHNNFINNSVWDVNKDVVLTCAPNFLDDGKKGNYWSSYNSDHPVILTTCTDNFPQEKPYVFDYQAPIISFVSPENRTYASGAIQLSVNVSKENSRLEYSIDGDQTTPLQSNGLLMNLSEGTHQIIVYAEDEFGNLGSESIMFTFQVSTLVPSPSISGSPTPTQNPSTPQTESTSPSPSASFTTASPSIPEFPASAITLVLLGVILSLVISKKNKF